LYTFRFSKSIHLGSEGRRADINGELVTDKVRGGVFGINGDWSDMPSDENEAIAWIRNASRVKWFFTLSEAEARLFLEWFTKK
jgi:hypothetical protein